MFRLAGCLVLVGSFFAGVAAMGLYLTRSHDDRDARPDISGAPC